MPIDKKLLLSQLPPDTTFQILIFEEYMIPYGHLDTHRESHALFWYYLNAMRLYEEKIKGQIIIYEDEKDPAWNFQQLFQAIAIQYNVEPESMVKAWDLVDKQCLLLELPLLPDEYQYRFSTSASKGVQ